ncbi:MAG: alanine racemase [Myxococcota bacterium]
MSAEASEPNRVTFSRRRLAQSALAAPVVLSGSATACRLPTVEPPAVVEPPVNQYLPWIEVRADAIRNNASVISAATGGRRVVPVVKTNGYGLGDVQVARALDEVSVVWGTMVVRPSEALRLLDGGVRKPVLLMGARVDRPMAQALVLRGVRLSLTSLDEIAMLVPVARALRRPVPIHLEIDTGYGRMGALFSRAEEWARSLTGAKHLLLEGLSTYYVDDEAVTSVQVERFNAAIAKFKAAGLRPSIIHAPHSNPILGRPETLKGCNATRPGLIVYGVYPSARRQAVSQLNLQVAHRLMTRVLRVEKLEPGHGSIAGLPIKLDAPRYYATIGIGVHDGLRYYPASGKTKKVEIRGRLYDATDGRNYNHMMIDLGEDATDVIAGDVVKIFSWERPELHPNADVDTAYWQAFYGPDIRRTVI